MISHLPQEMSSLKNIREINISFNRWVKANVIFFIHLLNTKIYDCPGVILKGDAFILVLHVSNVLLYNLKMFTDIELSIMLHNIQVFCYVLVALWY